MNPVRLSIPNNKKEQKMSIHDTKLINIDSFNKSDFSNFQFPEEEKNLNIENQKQDNNPHTTITVPLSPVSKALTPDMSGGTNYTLPSSMDEDILLTNPNDIQDGPTHKVKNSSETHEILKSPIPASLSTSTEISKYNSVSNSQITIKQYLQDIDPLHRSHNSEHEINYTQPERTFQSNPKPYDPYNDNDGEDDATESCKLLGDNSNSNAGPKVNSTVVNPSNGKRSSSQRRYTEPVPPFSMSIRRNENDDADNAIDNRMNGYTTSSDIRGSDGITLTRRSLDPTPAPRIKLHSLVNKSKSQSHIQTLDSGSKEIERMRNSLISKKPVKKKKRDFLEDDRVLVGNKISEGHANFVMAYNMLTGIRVAVSRCSGIMKPLTDVDFETTKKLSFGMDGTELTPSSKYDFKFKDYCPAVFRELRTLFGLDPADYLVSVTGKYILSELGSPGKSGSFFYYSRDYRFIIKTIHHSEHKQLKKILKDYYSHVKKYPNTLISQFYGLHRVKMPFGKKGVRKVHFVVMNNLFPPHRDIHTKYDLKGSTFGRVTDVEPFIQKGDSSYTLKDLNWLKNKDKIKFGPIKRKQFLTQLNADVKLLQKLNVMDYSLLLGIHDVKIGNRDDLTSQRLSVFEPVAGDKRSLIKTNPRNINRLNDLPITEFPDRAKFLFYGDDGGIRATNENNEPLPEIYYLGIIDCLTNYSLKKKLETFWRSMNHSRKTISAVPAHEYGERFLRFIKNGIKSGEDEKKQSKRD